LPDQALQLLSILGEIGDDLPSSGDYFIFWIAISHRRHSRESW